MSRALRIDITPRSIAYVLAAVAAIWVLFKLTNVILVIVVALILVGTIDPLVAWLERRGARRGRALALVFVLFALAFAGLLLLTVPPLVAQLIELTGEAPRLRDQLVAWLSQYEWGASLARSVRALPVDDLTVRATESLLGYSTVIITAISYAVTTMFLAIYLLADPVRSKGLLYAMVPRRYHVKLARVMLELKVIVGGYVRGQLITSAAIAVFVFIVLTALGIDNALALAAFAGLTDVIPFVGGLIASVPVVLAAADAGTVAMISVAILMVLYQEFESRLLVPRIYGQVLRLSPAVVIVALLIGGTLMGILGALLALPVAAGVQMLVRELRVDLPGETPADPATRALDAKAELAYEELADGATAADAGVIAEQLAEELRADASTEESASRAPPAPARR